VRSCNDLRYNTVYGNITLSKKYWCLFCGEDGPRWDTAEELFQHMKNTVHKTTDGGLVFYKDEVQ